MLLMLAFRDASWSSGWPEHPSQLKEWRSSRPDSSVTFTAGIDRVTSHRSDCSVRAARGKAADSSQTPHLGASRALLPYRRPKYLLFQHSLVSTCSFAGLLRGSVW